MKREKTGRDSILVEAQAGSYQTSTYSIIAELEIQLLVRLEGFRCFGVYWYDETKKPPVNKSKKGKHSTTVIASNTKAGQRKKFLQSLVDVFTYTSFLIVPSISSSDNNSNNNNNSSDSLNYPPSHAAGDNNTSNR